MLYDITMLKKFAYTNEPQPSDFPQIDVLLITHDHFDHMDLKTIKSLRIGQIICPLKVG